MTTTNQMEMDKGFVSALIAALVRRSDPPTKAEVEDKAKQLAIVFDYDGDLRSAVEEALVAIDTRMGAGISLVNVEANHDEEWVYKRTEIEWTYSEAYEKYLTAEKWQPTLVRSLSDVGTKILSHLQDPTSEGSWNRRGLVIGHVQSGKTANYMGVIAKAADAGYKFIIVIAGIHNNLRKQTQERIDEGFIGRSSDPENRVPVGVGLYGKFPHPATLTNVNEDFNKNTAAKSGWKINDFSKPIILVIKKNVTTLDALHKWLKELNAKGDGRISDVPMLLIDDEADNASINTNKEDVSPTRTNSMIRRILGLFEKSCYVGYTATPFANIFINPEAYDEDVREELFPRDFIYSLDAPNTYFGPEKVFLDEVSSARILGSITDCENYLPFSHKKDDTLAELPPSLYDAFDQFIIARAVRNLRGQEKKHCSMLINISRFMTTQRVVRDFVSLREKRVREAVKANYMMHEEASNKNEYMAALRRSYDNFFQGCGFEWLEVKKALNSVFDHLRIYVINSKSDEVLDYRKYERDGIGLTAIAIGGLSLSRGLTIEGLTVSYMYRNTKMYDTLMQMGRWFGYRLGFEDLCRVHLPQESIDWYSYIANASDELRLQITRMRRDKLSPKDFGFYVQAHPDSLLITAANKMRSGKKIIVKQNLTGKLVESTLLPIKSEINIKNDELIEEFWKRGFGGEVTATTKGWFIKNVAIAEIEAFITRFKAHKGFELQKGLLLKYLEAITDKFGIGDVLLISMGDAELAFKTYRLGPQQRKFQNFTADSWRLNGYRVASRGDEALGLDVPEVKQAHLEAANDTSNASANPSDYHYRVARNKPLLMVHVLAPTGSEAVEERIPAFGVSFPGGLFGSEVEIVANSVWLQQMAGALNDDPDDEDDYDE